MSVDLASSTLLDPELHAVIGAAVVFGLWLLVPTQRWRWAGLGAFFILDFFKEAFIDPATEPNNPLWPAGATDLAWYTVGVLIALAVIGGRFRRAPWKSPESLPR